MWQFAVCHYGDYGELMAGRDLARQQKMVSRREQELEKREKEVEGREQESRRREEESRQQAEANRLAAEKIKRRDERVKRRLQDADELGAKYKEQGRLEVEKAKVREASRAETDKRQ
jgi:colicin import membrane protein